MTLTAKVDYVEYAGDTLDMDFLIYNKNTTIPKNFSGCLVRIQVWDQDKNLVLTRSSATNDIILNRSSKSNILVSISKTDTAQLGIGSYTYAIILTDTDNHDNTMIVGTIQLQGR